MGLVKPGEFWLNTTSSVSANTGVCALNRLQSLQETVEILEHIGRRRQVELSGPAANLLFSSLMQISTTTSHLLWASQFLPVALISAGFE